MLPFIRVGPLLVQLPGLALLAGIWIGINLAEKEALRLRLNASAIESMTMYGLIGGVIGARLLYALEHLDAYAAAPLSLLALSTTALDGWGGLVVGAIVGFLYGRKHHLPLRPALDAFVNAAIQTVTGTVTLRLYKGNVAVAGRTSPYSLYQTGLAAFSMDGYNPKDAEGFIRILGLPARVQAPLRKAVGQTAMDGFVRTEPTHQETAHA